MNNRKKYTYGLENESILINEQGIPQYFINEQKTSTLLIKLFQKQYPHLKNMIKPELDACQIELINPNPHTSLEKATQEIAEGLYRIATIAKNF